MPDDGQGSPPVPDPTVLTTEAQARAMASMRDYVDGQLAVLAERLRGIDRATELLNETVNRVPTDVQKEVQHLRELMEERSAGVTTRFDLVERQRLEQKADTDKAVQAALSAAKEAVKEQTTASQLSTNKSESSMTEQLKQQSATFTTAINAQAASQNDLKTRVERIENIKQGGQEKMTGVYAAIAALAALVLIVSGIAAIVVAKAGG